VIEWLERVDPDRLFLTADGRSWSYAEAVERVASRVQPHPVLVRPTLTANSVFDLLAAVSGGGATVVGPTPETNTAAETDLVVFTSGSTGTPKGVRLTKANLEAAASASQRHLGHGPDDVWLLSMPLHHVGGLSIVVRQVYAGGAIALLPKFEGAAVAGAIRDGVTMMSVVPTMLARLLDHGPFEGLRAVLVGGGPIPAGLLERARDVGLPVLPTYGMTETFGQVATLRPDAPLGYRAHPLPGVELRIEPDGRIAVKGPQVSPGYVCEPDRAVPWFVTNDLGEIDDEGAVTVVGRSDTVIVTGGENVSPESVENVIESHPAVEEAVVVGVPDPDWGQMVVCVYRGEPGDIEQWVRERLPAFMVPKRWIQVPYLPSTSLGKPDREAARSLALAE
jgi:O-succinylbenzoic acid--CoA ligase